MKHLTFLLFAALAACGGDDKKPTPANPEAARACVAMAKVYESSMARCGFSDETRTKFRSGWEQQFGDDCSMVVSVRDMGELEECFQWVDQSNCHDVMDAFRTDTSPEVCRRQFNLPDDGKL